MQCCNTFKKDSSALIFIERAQDSGKQRNLSIAYARLSNV